MAGITSYGAYIPRYRMDRKLISEQLAWFGSRGKGEKAVANHDEDSITISYSAARNCLKAAGIPKVDGLYLGSMSLPFANRQNAGVVSSALGLENPLKTIDMSSSARCGTAALLAALDGAAAGGNYLACAAECRSPKPGSSQEIAWGDAGAAVLTGTENVLAELITSYSLAADFIDFRRLSGDRFEFGWEERWVRDEGFMKLVPQTFAGLLKKAGLVPSDISCVVMATGNSGVIRALPKRLGVAPEAVVQDNLADTVGDTGAAHPLLMLCCALDSAAPGDKIALLDFGYGCDALLFEVTNKIGDARKDMTRVARQIEDKIPLFPYARYLAYKDLIPLELGIRGESVSAASMNVAWREGQTIASLTGVKCKICGQPQYPRHRICVKCGAEDNMEPYSFVGRNVRVVSFTADYLSFSHDPPQLYGLLDAPEGGRLLLDFTDCRANEISVGLEMELTFRKKFTDSTRGNTVYFWKARPVK